MAAQIIPLQPTAAQTLTVSLANQACQIRLSQVSTGLFLDLYVNDSLIIGGVLCENLNRIVRDSYLGFLGDLMFVDNQGSTDPIYTGLGTRYSLAYIPAEDLPEDD